MSRKWGILIFIIVVVLIFIGIGIGLYFYFRPPRTWGFAVEADTKYYLSEMRSGLFKYPNSEGMDSDDLIHPIGQDTSYCIFENDYKTFKISFISNMNINTDFVFVVTKVKRGRDFTATIRHVLNGDIAEYTLKSTADAITVVATAIYKVTVGNAEQDPSPVEEIFRGNSDVLIFTKDIPEYIAEIVP